MDLSQFNEALNRLDVEIVAAEERLADLRLKRKGAEAFLSYMQPSGPAVAHRKTDAPQLAARRSTLPTSGVVGVTDFVASIAQANPEVIVTIDFVLDQTRAQGREFTREQVKNALHYLARKGVLVKSSDRGSWQLPTDTETPAAATGVSVGNVLPHQEGGDSHETTEPTASTAEDHSDLQLGASITEVAS